MVVNLVRASALLPYSGTYFGYFWTLCRPFIFLAIMIFIKNRSGSDMGEEIPYPLYLYSGLVLWWYLVDAIKQSARSPLTYQGLITKIYFPRVIVPFVPVLGRLLDLAIQAVGIVVMMIIFDRYPDEHIYLLPIAMINVLLLCLGLGYLVSVLMVGFRDTERILDYLLYTGLFLSPVLYTTRLVPDGFRDLYSWINPTVGPLMAFRAALFSGASPDFPALLHSLIVSVLFCLLGLFLFLKVQSSLAERM
jgi:lipopolysaccharide transport system permease protein